MPELVPSLAPQAERLRKFAERTVAQGPVGIQPVIIAGDLRGLEYGDDPLGWIINGFRAAQVGLFSYIGVRAVSGLVVVEHILVSVPASGRFFVQINRGASTILAADALGLASTNSRIVPSVRRVNADNASGVLGSNIVHARGVTDTSVYLPLRMVLEPTDAIWVVPDAANEAVEASMWGTVYGDAS